MKTDKQSILDDIDRILAESNEIESTTRTVPSSASNFLGRSDRPPRTVTKRSTEDITRACLLLSSAITRYTTPGSPFRKQMDAILTQNGPSKDYVREQLRGVLSGIRHEYEHGALTSVTELVHRDLFSDFLDMARHLAEKGFKDPAAVVAAGVLEQHLRRLAEKNSVPLFKDNGENRTTESINIDLAKAGTYDSATQKEVTAKLSLRNQAAHAEWDKYDIRQVPIFIDWIQFFISKYPA
ncbi:hypothetical protein [Corallococcus exiguus]|uniref:hypothetical protein n=1 Tax=Corallococcus exiguus TaxID=83462 RepID=UPI003DA643D7